MNGGLSQRNVATLEAAARIFIPAGGAIEYSADDLRIAEQVAGNISTWPPRVRLQIRALLTSFERMPLTAGHRRTFTRLDPGDQKAFLEATYHHASPTRRMFAGLVKQLCYTIYLCSPEVEEAVGYRYECLRPREVMPPEPGERMHH